MDFPIDLGAYQPLALDPSEPELSDGQKRQLQDNIQLCRDVVVLMTAVSDAKGLGGHTGGAFDIVPEVLVADGFMRGTDRVLPIYFDEAGHRVAIQYLMSVLNGHMEAERLLRHREANSGLPGHPERGFTPGIEFSSGRLGHLWAYCNGVALGNSKKTVILFGSDGSQQEGTNAEAARLAVAHGIDIKLIIDANDVTIAGHPSEYMPGFDLAKTLRGHGLQVHEGQGEDLDGLFARMCKAMCTPGPVAVINRRPMAPGINGLEGTSRGHDAIPLRTAIEYLDGHGQHRAAMYLQAVKRLERPRGLQGSTLETGKNRDVFGKTLCDVLSAMTPEERKQRVLAIDNDLEGSCGLGHVRQAFPEIFVAGGIMERSNYCVAAGFGAKPGCQGIFATFAAFLEMVISEITMARLNEANVLAHFSHSGVDDMADNNCHFGLNVMHADNGWYTADNTRLYYPADPGQMRAVVERVFAEPGLRFVFSTRSAVPTILNTDGKPFYGEGYQFVPGRDEVIREGSSGYVISFGELLYRCLDAVERLRAAGLDVGLINKPTLNVVDEHAIQMAGSSPFVLVVEGLNHKAGLGIRYGTWLLQRGLSPKYAHIGADQIGNGGLWEQLGHQGLDPDEILKKVQEMAR